MTTENERAKDQARAQFESIKEMVAALNVDWDRLEELRDLEEGKHLDVPEQEELKGLEEAAGDCTDREQAEQRIQEDPLSVQVRSDWHNPGTRFDEPTEFQILLCTGGPAVKIEGDLDQYNQPESARIYYQDWFTPWEELRLTSEEENIVLDYCRCFWFGD